MLSLGALRRRPAGFDAARGGLLNRAPFPEWHRRLLPSSDQSNVTATRDRPQARVIKRSVIARPARRWDARSPRGPPAPHVTGAVDTRNYVTAENSMRHSPCTPSISMGEATQVHAGLARDVRAGHHRGRRRASGAGGAGDARGQVRLAAGDWGRRRQRIWV